MPAIVVDASRCKKDGLCASVCPLGILELPNGALPQTREGYESRCVSCGHCMAVCPHDALLLEGTRREELLPVDATGYPSADALSHLMRSRRSTRLYKDELVERSVIEGMLDVARWAPTGKNEQPLRYSVVNGREPMKQLALHCIDFFRELLQNEPGKALYLGAGGLVKAWESGQDPILRGAPQLIVAHGPQQNPVLIGSGLIALTQIELQALARGLGACWAGYLQIAAGGHAPLRSALGLPAGDAVAGALILGIPKVRFRRIPPRKPLQVNWL